MEDKRDPILEKISKMTSDDIGKWHDDKTLELKELLRDYHKSKDDLIKLKEQQLILKHKKEKEFIQQELKESQIERELRRDKDLYNLKILIFKQRSLIESAESPIDDVRLACEILKDNYFRNK